MVLLASGMSKVPKKHHTGPEYAAAVATTDTITVTIISQLQSLKEKNLLPCRYWHVRPSVLQGICHGLVERVQVYRASPVPELVPS